MRYVVGLALLALCVTAMAASRPPMTSVSHLAVYDADLAKAERFYVHDLGAIKAADPEDPAGARYYFSPTQFVEVLPLPATAGLNRADQSLSTPPTPKPCGNIWHRRKSRCRAP